MDILLIFASGMLVGSFITWMIHRNDWSDGFKEGVAHNIKVQIGSGCNASPKGESK